MIKKQTEEAKVKVNNVVDVLIQVCDSFSPAMASSNLETEKRTYRGDSQ